MSNMQKKIIFTGTGCVLIYLNEITSHVKYAEKNIPIHSEGGLHGLVDWNAIT